MRRGAVVIGVACGALAAIRLILSSAGPEEEHPLPSATEAWRTPPQPRGSESHPRWMPRALAVATGIEPAPVPAGVPVTIRVVDEQERPVAGAMVESRLDPVQAAIARGQTYVDQMVVADDVGEAGPPPASEHGPGSVTGADGRAVVRLLPAVTAVLIAREGDSLGISEEIQVAAADPPPETTVRLVRRGAVSGVLRNPQGNPVSGAAVSLYSLAGGSAVSRLAADLLPTATASDAAGGFRIPLAGGVYRVEVAAPGFQPLWEGAVQVLAGEETRLERTLQIGYVVAGRVIDGHGRAVEGASVSVFGCGGSATVSGPDGSFRAEGLAPGHCFLSVQAEGFLNNRQWEGTPGGPPVNVELQPGGGLDLEVAVARELLPPEPAGYCQIELASADGTDMRAAGVAIDENGHGTTALSGLSPGHWKVAVRVMGTGLVTESEEVAVQAERRTTAHLSFARASVAAMPPAIVDPVPEAARFSPALDYTWDAGELVVTIPPPGSGLLPGDRMVSVGGAVDTGSMMMAFPGDQGTLCEIVARRPANGEQVTAWLPRTRQSGAERFIDD